MCDCPGIRISLDDVYLEVRGPDWTEETKLEVELAAGQTKIHMSRRVAENLVDELYKFLYDECHHPDSLEKELDKLKLEIEELKETNAYLEDALEAVKV